MQLDSRPKVFNLHELQCHLGKSANKGDLWYFISYYQMGSDDHYQVEELAVPFISRKIQLISNPEMYVIRFAYSHFRN